MKIIVTSESTDNFKSVSDVTWAIVAEYCDRHSYEFRPKVVVESERGPVWERVRSLQSALQDCDWAVHVDADWLATNHRIPLTEFIENDKSIVISCSPYQGKPMFNDGFFMVKSDSDGAYLLNKVWRTGPKPEIELFCAQDVMWGLYNCGSWQSSWSVQPQKRFNSFLWSEYGEPDYKQGSWTRGDFALHLPGMTNERRVELLNQYLPEIIR